MACGIRLGPALDPSATQQTISLIEYTGLTRGDGAFGGFQNDLGLSKVLVQ